MERAHHLPMFHSRRAAGSREARASRSLRARAWLARFRLDRELAGGADLHEPLRRERARTLIDPDRRERLASDLERMLSAAEKLPRGLSAEAPLDRRAIAQARPLLLSLVGELRAPGAVSPQGVARVVLLLTDGASVLYRTGTGPPGEHGVELRAARTALHVGPKLEDGGSSR